MILDASYTLLVACIALLIGMFVVKFTPFPTKKPHTRSRRWWLYCCNCSVNY